MPHTTMLTQTGSCPVCGHTNSHAEVSCGDCGFRLPWADQAEATADARWESAPAPDVPLPLSTRPAGSHALDVRPPRLECLTTGFIGSATVALGVFLPVLIDANQRASNYFGPFVLLASFVSLALVAKHMFKPLALTGTACLLTLVYTYFEYRVQLVFLPQVENGKMLDAFQAAQLQHPPHLSWGFAVMLIGSILLILSAVLDWRGS